MIEFLTDNAVALAAVGIAVLALVKAVVAVTPSKADDEFVARVEEVVKRLTGKGV